MSQFDDSIDAIVGLLSAGTPVSAHIEADRDPSDALPAGWADAVVVNLQGSQPQNPAGIRSNPVDWQTRIAVHCIAVEAGISARTAVNTLSAAVYARLAASPTLGLGDEFDLGEPAMAWEFERTEKRAAACTLIYPLAHRTSAGTLE